MKGSTREQDGMEQQGDRMEWMNKGAGWNEFTWGQGGMVWINKGAGWVGKTWNGTTLAGRMQWNIR
jgi:hypothetical protein